MTIPAFAKRDPDSRGYYGAYGGRFVPETLVAPVAELEAAYMDARRRIAAFIEPPARPAARLRRPPDAALRGAPPERQRSAARASSSSARISRTPAPTRSTTRSARGCWPQRMGKRRVIAETGAGQHGVATATVCALLGLQCDVYMGAEDMERQALNVFRMELLGATVRRVDAGAKTLKDAINEAMRDWVANVADSYYLLGSVLGPHPYPLMVREFQSVIGQEARRQCIEATGALPDTIVACVGGGSNAMGIFDAFIDDPDVQADRRRGGRPRHPLRRARGALRRRQRRRAAGHAHLRPAGSATATSS